MEIIDMTESEWRAKGTELFGEDMYKWKFKCPNCGNVQCVNDFKAYKDQGASPASVNFNCIGRYSGGEGTIGDGKSPCNYTSGGLFNLNPVRVTTKDGKVQFSFAFAEEG